MDKRRITTRCAQAREDLPSDNRPLIAPIYQSAVWTLDSLEQCEAVYAGDAPGYIYTRDANPNHAALERAVADLEGAEAAVAFGTGMAGIAAALTALARSGDQVAASRYLYGATARLLDGELSRFGVETLWVDTTDLEAVEASLSPRTSVLLVETVANPLLQVADVRALAALCGRFGTRMVVDNTFATPLGCRPLALGADVSLHSVTKFLAGHSDVTLGAAAGRREVMDALRVQARLWGGAANPFESWLALRGITTFPLRMERSAGNALELARRLEAHRGVRRVYYPGLPSHPQHTLAANILENGGAMLAFDAGSGEAARAVLRRLRSVRFAPSLGDTATTISYPAATSHRALAPEVRAALGITDGILRLSVGIDHVDDVWEDLEQALAGS